MPGFPHAGDRKLHRVGSLRESRPKQPSASVTVSSVTAFTTIRAPGFFSSAAPTISARFPDEPPTKTASAREAPPVRRARSPPPGAGSKGRISRGFVRSARAHPAPVRRHRPRLPRAPARSRRSPSRCRAPTSQTVIPAAGAASRPRRRGPPLWSSASRRAKTRRPAGPWAAGSGRASGFRTSMTLSGSNARPASSAAFPP